MTRVEAETQARELRHQQDVGSGEPIDILKLAQDAGALVVLKSIQDGPQGMLGVRGSDAWIFVNTVAAQSPLLGRMRFTIAHELGHLILGHGGVVDVSIDLGAQTGEEADANAFAAELLVPELELKRMFGLQRSSLGVAALVAIAARFGVSAHVALFRLDRAGLVSAATRKQLGAKLAAREHLQGRYRRQQLEYTDLLTVRVRDAASTSAIVLPREISQRVEELWESGLLDDAEAAAHLHVTESKFLRMMRQQGVERAIPDSDSEWW